LKFWDCHDHQCTDQRLSSASRTSEPGFDAVKAELEAHGLHPELGTMSTQVVDDAEAVFAALRDAFSRIAASGQVVMTVTLSNACPV
jgi:uncharacterized protein YqgV (UPF0045/DUF77 family)